jgi:hypothetical protein
VSDDDESKEGLVERARAQGNGTPENGYMKKIGQLEEDGENMLELSKR